MDKLEKLIDTHAHLDFPEFGPDIDVLIDRAAEKGVAEIITIGVDLPSSQKAVELAGAHPQIFAAVGVHPHDAFDMDDESMESLCVLARERRVVGYGEIGLDYYRGYKPVDIQKRCFERQLELVCELRMPAVFHVREAHDDFFRIVEKFSHRLSGGILHCFSGDWKVAERCLDMGFYLSVPGTVTYSNASVQQDVVRRAPFERLLVETDCPYLAPVPFRGKTNEPAYVHYTAEKVAELRGCSLDEVARQTTQNAHRVFSLNRFGVSEKVSG
jgi:TatD DNase family protein